MTDDINSTLDSFLIRIGALEQERDALKAKLAEVEHQRDSALTKLEDVEHQRDALQVVELPDITQDALDMLHPHIDAALVDLARAFVELVNKERGV